MQRLQDAGRRRDRARTPTWPAWSRSSASAPLNPTPNAGQPQDHAASRATSARRTSPQIVERLQQAVAGIPGMTRLLPAGAGHPDQHARQPRAVSSTRWSAPTPTRSAPGSARLAEQLRTVAASARRRLGGAGRRPARMVKVDRETAGRLGVSHAGGQRHAQRRLRPAPDLDHLRPGQPVPRGAGGDAAVSERSRRAGAALRPRHRRRAGAAERVRHASSARTAPLVDRAPGAVPLGHHQLQPGARRLAERRGRRRSPRPSARSACRHR